MEKKFSFGLLALFAAMVLVLPGAGEAKTYHVVRDVDGSTKVIDPSDTLMNRVTHPLRYFGKWFRRPPEKKPVGFGGPLSQCGMDDSITVTKRVTQTAENAATAVTQMPIVRSYTKPIAQFFRSAKRPRARPQQSEKFAKKQ